MRLLLESFLVVYRFLNALNQSLQNGLQPQSDLEHQRGRRLSVKTDLITLLAIKCNAFGFLQHLVTKFPCLYLISQKNDVYAHQMRGNRAY